MVVVVLLACIVIVVGFVLVAENRTNVRELFGILATALNPSSLSDSGSLPKNFGGHGHRTKGLRTNENPFVFCFQRG